MLPYLISLRAMSVLGVKREVLRGNEVIVQFWSKTRVKAKV